MSSEVVTWRYINHHTYKDCPHNPAGGAPASRTCSCIAILKMFASTGGWWGNWFWRLAAGGGRVARVIARGGASGPTPLPQAAAAAAVRETLPPLLPASPRLPLPRPLLPPAQPPASPSCSRVLAGYDEDYETECESDDVGYFSATDHADELLLLMGRGAGALDTTELSRCIYIVDMLCSQLEGRSAAEDLQWCTLRAGLQRSYEIGCMAEEAAREIEKYADKLHKQTEVLNRQTANDVLLAAQL